VEDQLQSVHAGSLPILPVLIWNLHVAWHDVRGKGHNMVEKDELLAQAERHIFSTGLLDGATYLCKVNMKYGLAKIHWVQQRLGLNPDATFISTPDMPISRNATRWKSGFGYGGKLSWGDGNTELVILNIKPNSCGMMVGGLDRFPDCSELVGKLDKLMDRKAEIDGIEIEWDFHLSNHFIDLFWVKTKSRPLALHNDHGV
jgi:hypothetical protein